MAYLDYYFYTTAFSATFYIPSIHYILSNLFRTTPHSLLIVMMYSCLFCIWLSFNLKIVVWVERDGEEYRTERNVLWTQRTPEESRTLLFEFHFIFINRFILMTFSFDGKYNQLLRLCSAGKCVRVGDREVEIEKESCMRANNLNLKQKMHMCFRFNPFYCVYLINIPCKK